MSDSSAEDTCRDKEASNESSQDQESSKESKPVSRNVLLRPSVLQTQTSKFSPNPGSKPAETGSKPSFSFANPFRKSSPENGATPTDLFGTARPNNPFGGAAPAGEAKNPGNNNGGSFVFGQNMQARVTNADATEAPQNGEELTFSPTTVSNSKSPLTPEQHAKSLEESAQEYQSRQVKRTYEEVSVVTGEEGESNVIQLASKLYAFDKDTSAWVERGRGLLRLNDKEVDGSVVSRVIIRNHGSLRVVLNAQIWADMKIERPNDKSLRTTVCETDGIKLYLIMANPKEIEQLFNAMQCRISNLRSMAAGSPDKQATSTGSPSMKRSRLDNIADQKATTDTDAAESK